MSMSMFHIFQSPIKTSMNDAASGGPGYMGRDERKAHKQAEEAEKAFRASKGYEPDTVWYRLKKKFIK